jgi:hypothetical protein
MHRDIKLKEGEELCNRCIGAGFLEKEGEYCISCPKCLGRGKLDWVEQIVGAKELSVDFSQFVSTCTKLYDDESELYTKAFVDMIIEKFESDLENKLARSFLGYSEHNKNQYLREDVDDNRVFSEHMFFSATKSKVEDKKD